ncbi:uncharacterized protein LOC124259487 isoform X2 [Haliotis rubra]|uniref:uncharacterized protein LOC124259487 isoform X2 n=1 Tax=Haliotis rubra TaxID=36100 RepID=UPI001EE4FC9B|nr:uncharacterized protein LOC124259487 isoform X2 [Haliotis rubra]
MWKGVLHPVVLVVLVAGCVGEQHPTCQLWKKMAQQLSNEPRKQMTCFANDTHPCTSLRCSGTYKYTSFMPDSADIEVDYCFGMRLNHCDNPVSMDIYLVVPNKNMSYNKRISHNTQIKMPGLSFHLKSLGTVDVFLYFYMLRNASNIHMSITAKFRITSFMNTIMWPPSLQKEIVPMESIPVPPCMNGSTPAPPTTLPMGSCHPPRWIAPTNPPGVSSTPYTPHSSKKASLTYNHPCYEDTFICSAEEACDLLTKKCVCRSNFLYDVQQKRCVSRNRIGIRCSSSTQCGPNEACIRGRCHCKVGYAFSMFYEVCYAGRPKVSTVSPPVTQRPQVVTLPSKQQPQTAPPSASNSTAIIAASVVSGIVVLCLICLVIFFLVKRVRRPYQDREILLSNDDTDVIM